MSGSSTGNGGGGTGDAAQSLAMLQGAGDSAASAIGTAFEKAGVSLAASLTRAAETGKLSMADLAKAAISALNGIEQAAFGGSSGGGGLGAALGAALGSGASGEPFGGARADGGPVSSGGAYLVGERGPEVFRPGVGGSIDAATGSGGVTVNLTLQSADGPASLFHSETQIAQALARAASVGVR